MSKEKKVEDLEKEMFRTKRYLRMKEKEEIACLSSADCGFACPLHIRVDVESARIDYIKSQAAYEVARAELKIERMKSHVG